MGGLVWAGGGGALLLLIAAAAVVTFNKLVSQRNRVKNAWAQVDVQLKRRHDLVPNMVSAVRGYMQHERDLLERVTRARNLAVSSQSDLAAQTRAEAELSSSLRGLFAVVESYPQLRADGQVRMLGEELTSTENRIAYARQHYNDAVMSYNTTRETLPRSLFAGIFGFSEMPVFTVDDAAERSVPKVQL